MKAVLENETVKALKWFEENHMKVNPDKFQCILHNKPLTQNFVSPLVIQSLSHQTQWTYWG